MCALDGAKMHAKITAKSAWINSRNTSWPLSHNSLTLGKYLATTHQTHTFTGWMDSENKTEAPRLLRLPRQKCVAGTVRTRKITGMLRRIVDIFRGLCIRSSNFPFRQPKRIWSPETWPSRPSTVRSQLRQRRRRHPDCLRQSLLRPFVLCASFSFWLRVIRVCVPLLWWLRI